jgi:exopolyphosphatase / guanosine-5'-triphosphate,3'-diphosphate pyrophosphatase
MVLACIDIGSNTTRLLVAEASGRELRELSSERVFTHIGRALRTGGEVSDEKVSETAKVVAAQTRSAAELGAEEVIAVATAAIRGASNREELAAAIEEAGGMPLWILSDEEEARLSFLGATRTLRPPPVGTIAVVDVGGGSTELAVGEPDGSVAWSTSFSIGSGLLTDVHLKSDPPSASELAAMGRDVEAKFAGLDPPPCESAVAVGGTATSLRRFVGGDLTPESLDSAVRSLGKSTVDELAERIGLHRERVRLLPAGILLLRGMAAALGRPLRIAQGGLREGAILELVEARERG